MAQPGSTNNFARLLGGVLLIAIGLVLVFNSASAVRLIIWLLAAGLVISGLLRFAELRDGSVRRWPLMLAGGLLVFSGIGLPFWHGASLPVLALAVSLVLLVGGVLRLAAVFRGRQKYCFRGALTALTGIFGAVLVIFWPRLSLWVLGVAFGGWLFLLGVRCLHPAFEHRVRKIPAWMRTAGQAGLTGLSALGLAAVLGLGTATAYLHSQNQLAAADDFYLPPASVPAAHGQLLRAEPLEANTLPNTLAWRIIYTTQGPDGAASVASGLVTIADSAKGTLPVISWANGTKGVTSQCALSMAANPYDDGPARARETMLADGWAIVAADYIGLGTTGPHPYLIPAAEANAVLDATLAARQLQDLGSHGVQLGDSSVVWGHSQGGHAALATAESALDYAPDLDILGVAAMAPATDLPNLAESVADTSAGKIISSYIAYSWNQLYPALGIEKRLTARSRMAVNQLSQNCFSGTGALTGLAQSSQLFEPIFTPAELDGQLHAILLRNSSVIPVDYPVFIAQGAEDSLVLPSMRREFFKRSCTSDVHAGYLEYAGLDHMPLVGTGSALNEDLVAYTRSLLDGIPDFPEDATLCKK